MSNLKAGFIGLRHLHPKSYMPVLRAASIDVVAVAEADPAVLKSFGREFEVRMYHDAAAMLDAESLDLAVIFLPHNECPDAAVACAGRGVHLLVEKPMSSDAAGVARMIQAAAKAGVLLSTPYVWRYHPVARAMKQYIHDGILGRIVGCEGRCAAGRLHRYIDGNASWMLQRSASGGGPMHNLGVHWIDLYRWLLDDEVVEVIGKNVKVNEEYDIEDNSFALLTFSRGTVVALDISYTVPDSFPNGRDLHLALRGTAGVLAWSPSFEGVQERLFVSSDAPGFRQPEDNHVEFTLRSQPGYAGASTVEFLTDFVEAIRRRTAPAITGEDGLRTLEVVEAVYESARTGRSVQPARRTL